MRNKTVKRAVYGGVVAVVASLALVNAAAGGGEASARSKLVLMAPAAPGGGWDGFARESQQAMKSGGIVNNAQVVNVPGAATTSVYGPDNQKIGEIERVMIDKKSGQVAYAVLSFGGVFGLGEFLAFVATISKVWVPPWPVSTTSATCSASRRPPPSAWPPRRSRSRRRGRRSTCWPRCRSPATRR